MGHWEGRGAAATISEAVPVLISQQFFWSFEEQNLPACAPLCSLLPGGDVSLLDTTRELPLLFGKWGEIVLWGEAVSPVIEVESPSSKGWRIFYPRQGISSAGELDISTPHSGFFLLPSLIYSWCRACCAPRPTPSALPEAGTSVLPGARKVGRLHPCASLIDSWHRAGDVLMDGRQLPASDASTSIGQVTGHRPGTSGAGIGKSLGQPHESRLCLTPGGRLGMWQPR